MLTKLSALSFACLTSLSLLQTSNVAWAQSNATPTQANNEASSSKSDKTDTDTADKKKTRTLPEVKVTSKALTGTALHDNYTVDKSVNATKLNLKLKETPQSISTITEQQIQDQNLRDLVEIVEATPGLSANYGGPAGSGQNSRFYSRGFKLDTFQMDGMMSTEEGLGGSDFVGIMDPFLFENIDVVRGSTGLTTGMGDPSGSINFNRKKPFASNGGVINLKFGTWRNLKQEVDINRVLNEANTLKARLIATNSSSNMYIKRASTRNRTFAAMLAYDLTPQHHFGLGVSHQSFLADQVPPQAIYRKISNRERYPEQFPNSDTYGYYHYTLDDRIPREFNNATRWTYKTLNVTNIFGDYTFQFAPTWNARIAFNHVDGTRKGAYGVIGTYNGAGAWEPGRKRASYQFKNWDQKVNSTLVDANIKGAWTWRNLEQQITFGVNGYASKVAGLGYQRTIPGSGEYFWDIMHMDLWNDGDINVQNYKDGHNLVGPYVPVPGWDNSVKTKVYGPYFAWQIKPMQKLSAIVGARYNIMKHDWGGDVPRNRKVMMSNLKKTTPYLSLTYEVTPQINAYASYTGIFKDPTTENYENFNKEGGFNPPIVGNTKEIGLKGEFYDGDLNAAISYFDMVQNNLPVGKFSGIVTDENGIRQSLQYIIIADGYHNRGLDINIAGKITPQWKITAGYTQLKSDFKKVPNLLQDGSAYTQDSFYAPKHLFKIFTNYHINNFTLGAGLHWQSQVIETGNPVFNEDNKNDPNAVKQDPYYIVNLMLNYRINKNFSFALNANNIFNKQYMTTQNGNFFGPPRNFTVRASYEF